MPAPEPFRIILRDANGTIRAMAECTADPAVTLSTYAADGGQMSSDRGDDPRSA